MSEILTAEQLAQRWQVPTTWIYAKCRTGELPKLPLPGKYVRFSLEAVERFEAGWTNHNDDGRKPHEDHQERLGPH